MNESIKTEEHLRAALTNLAELGINAFVDWLRAPVVSQTAPAWPPAPFDEPRRDPDRDGNASPPEYDDPDAAAREAADLLGVPLTATAGEVRAAFRTRIKAEAATGTFHDQRGGGTDERAQMLITAKNLLVERAAAVAA